MAEMKLKDYEHHFEELGISLDPVQLRRHKKLLYHIDVTLDYLERRLEEDDDWWIVGTFASLRSDLLASQGMDQDKIVEQAKSELQRITAISGNNPEKTIQLSGWMDAWLNPKGLSRLRNSLNIRLQALSTSTESKMVRIPVSGHTRGRFNQLLESTGPKQGYDEFMNRLINFYAQMHGIKLDDGKKAGQ